MMMVALQIVQAPEVKKGSTINSWHLPHGTNQASYEDE